MNNYRNADEAAEDRDDDGADYDGDYTDDEGDEPTILCPFAAAKSSKTHRGVRVASGTSRRKTMWRPASRSG